MSASELETVWAEGRRKLAADPLFGPWVERVGPIRVPVTRDPPFAYLVRSIAYQQLAGAAARTIHGRVVEALRGEVTPQSVLHAKEGRLREAGLSRNKLAAIRDLATKVSVGDVALEDLGEQEDGEVTRRLTKVRGIGPWTAHMYLMFALRRPDVWPVGDLGVRGGFAKVHGLEESPSEKELEPLGAPYRPWRSAAAYYCWRVLETELT